jgi:peptidyl-prolyl isomerase E (cyclophilin E)
LFTEKHRGFGFVEFETIEDASAAVDNMHNSELMGKVITVVTASPAVLTNKGKAVWADNAGGTTEEGQESSADQNDEDSRIKTSEVQVNAPKRLKTSEIDAQPLPQGM